MYGLWGLGLMMLSKAIIVVDQDVPVQDVAAVAARVLETVDWRRDVTIVDGPVDQLDHSAILDSYGGKIGLDATRKPDRAPYPPNAPVEPARITAALGGDNWHTWNDAVLIAGVDSANGAKRDILAALWQAAPGYNIILLDHTADTRSLSDAAWRALGNVDWRRDVVIPGGPVNPYPQGDQPRSPIGIDATSKNAADGHPRGWPKEIMMLPEVAARVSERWGEYGIE
jgi:4-hydroxy-3-polyprenylbenzoate decarboxylase